MLRGEKENNADCSCFLRRGSEGDDVGIVAGGGVVEEVAEAIAANFGLSGDEGWTGVEVGTAGVHSDERPCGFAGALAFDLDAVVCAFDPFEEDLRAGLGGGGCIGFRGSGGRGHRRDNAPILTHRLRIIWVCLDALNGGTNSRHDAGGGNDGGGRNRGDGGCGGGDDTEMTIAEGVFVLVALLCLFLENGGEIDDVGDHGVIVLDGGDIGGDKANVKGVGGKFELEIVVPYDELGVLSGPVQSAIGFLL